MKHAPEKKKSDEMRNIGLFEIFVLVLSLYVLGALLAQTVFHISSEVSLLLDRIDALVCVIFLTDFWVRLRLAPSKLAFMKWGWIDLISSIPSYDFLRWGRLVRVVRIIRILRAFRSSRHLVAVLYRHRMRSLAFTAALIGVILVIFSSISILVFENDTESNIRTPFDALWWAISTMTTVGYGDTVPVTVEGKVIAMILMIAGVGLFGVLTGIFARLFVEPQLQREDFEIKELIAETKRLRDAVERLERRVIEKPVGEQHDR